MNIYEAEDFIFEHKITICIILIVIMVCCLIVTALNDFIIGFVPASAGMNYIIKDESGINKENMVAGRDEAMEFGRICINNSCSSADDSSFHISDNSEGIYTIYQDRAEIDFDEYYKIYPCAVIDSNGNVTVSLHKILHSQHPALVPAA